jgi:hypothetical protein
MYGQYLQIFRLMIFKRQAMIMIRLRILFRLVEIMKGGVFDDRFYVENIYPNRLY